MANKYQKAEQKIQGEYLKSHYPAAVGYEGKDYRMDKANKPLNIQPFSRKYALRFFSQEPKIQWHTHTSHGLSSQMCCVNFLTPFITRPDILSHWAGKVLGIDPPEILPVDRDRGLGTSYLTFEWISDKDFLSEGNGRDRKRGANATATDAAFAYRDADGKVVLVLIEWKYTESYSGMLEESGNETRKKRYEKIYQSPNGPIKKEKGLDITDFFWNPFYQLLRQQMMAFHVEKNRDIIGNGIDIKIDKAMVLHLSPEKNEILHKIRNEKIKVLGKKHDDDVFKVFTSLLKEPDRFKTEDIGEAFSPLLGYPGAEWVVDLKERYPSLFEKKAV